MPKSLARTTLPALAAALAAACYNAPEIAHLSRGTRAPGQRDDITRQEIQTVLREASTAYDIVKLRRPGMLLRRTVTGVERAPMLMTNEIPGVHVHVDRSHVGELDLLSTIPAQAVASIRWLSAGEASTEYGNGHNAGVIAVATLYGVDDFRRVGSR